MSDQNKPLKIEFAPGCFDHFEGTQEELDGLLAELKNMFENLTPEELEARSRPITDEDLEDLPEDVIEQILNFDSENPGKKRLQ